MEQLISKQGVDGKTIQKINTNFRKDSATRKTPEYCATRLQQLNATWAAFEARNIELEQFKDSGANQNYFKDNFFTKVEQLYEQTRDLIEDALKEAIDRKKSSEMVQEQLRNLKKQLALIESLHRAIERIQKELDSKQSKAYITQKIKLLNDYWELIVKNHGEIQSMGRFKDEYFDNNVYANTEDKYQDILIKLQEALEQTSSPQQLNPAASKQKDEASVHQDKRRVKLPTIEIPIFNGNYLKWQSFKDLFTELIQKNETIGKAEKLFYLKTNLIGEPQELIKHLQITSENYDTAWGILIKRYDNKRTLITAHLRTLVDQPQLTKETADGIKALHDTCTECLQAIKNLGIETANWDPLVVFLLTDKLDRDTRRLYEQSLKNPREIQTLQHFLEFLENRFQALEALEPSKRDKKADKPDKSIKVHHSTIGKQNCPVCKGNHKIYACEKLLKWNPTQRLEYIKRAKLCVNCLTKGHPTPLCKSWQSCKICNKKHHTLLHLKSATSTNTVTVKETSLQPQKDTDITSHLAEHTSQSAILLATAIIKVVGKSGNVVELRALIDQGSQGTFISEDAVQQLRIPTEKIHATISGVGETQIGTINKRVEITIKPRIPSSFSLTVTALVLRKLTKLMPTKQVMPATWKHAKNLVLADPNYYIPGKIDIILGADVYAQILLENILRGGPGLPIAQQTELGWILFGEINNTAQNENLHCLISEVDIGNDLRRFWEIEEVQKEPILTPEDMACEKYYKATFKRGSDGRYTVRLPFKQNPEETDELNRTKQLAMARLFQMERKFKVDKTFATMYKDFMNEYLSLGHMVPVSDNIERGYYIPHHAVLKQDSSTTKLRVVFDASAKCNNSKSLNEIMMTGPQIQQNLASIVLRWRKHKFVFMADIEKMYRQIKVDARDQIYQRILWRTNPDSPIKEYQLTTVTYGTTAAPFLAIRTLQQLAKDDENIYPIAAKMVLHDSYVDDIVSGANSLEEVFESSDQLIKLLKGGGFNLRKWSSNSKELLQKIPWNLREWTNEIDFDTEKTIKALGIHWNPSADCFKIQVNINPDSAVTSKRNLLSEAAKIFDPLGLLSPVTVKIKLLLQEVWMQGTNWDEELSAEILQKWKRIKSELPLLQNIHIPRWVMYEGTHCSCELHGFSDASEKAYSAAVYLRVIYQGNVSSCLLTAKTKVAPLSSKLSLPKLELCGATLLANLLKEVKKSLEIDNLPCYAWTDSTIVMSWIRENPHTWKTFVANRVAEIQSTLDYTKWFYVKSNENPADCASRGIYPINLKNHPLWWEGPAWLKEIVIPYDIKSMDKTELERKKILVHVTTSEDSDLLDSLLKNYSTIEKVQRVLGYCIRFIKNIRAKTKPQNATRKKRSFNVQPLSIEELDNALTYVTRYTQQKHFGEDINQLLDGHNVHKTSRLFTLTPILDKHRVLRVGGRFDQATMTYQRKHPMILPHKSELTSLVIDRAHRIALHGGNSLTLHTVRQSFWIINGAKAVKNHINKCVKCHRQKAQMCQQMMGTLPKARVVTSPPFTHTGVDYAGPLELLLAKGRGNRTHKGYVSLFICLTTKAIHIEVVTDLTAQAFIAAFKRFVSRRGPVAHLYSDNGTNFVGASKIISDLHKQQSYRDEVYNSLQESGTQWHFIPPASPHFGGLWEAGVKSIKHHLRRVVGNTKLTYEEMCTLMTQIEACLNSRPLCPLNEDPESLDVLTPGHFLTGSPLLTVPEGDYLDTNPNVLTKWQHIERMKQEFWRKWSSEYIGRLQHRPKWAQRQENLKEGNLVLIKDKQMPPSRWALGRVIETHPGSDGLIRVVTLQTKNGRLKQPIANLSLLPIIDNTQKETSLSQLISRDDVPEVTSTTSLSSEDEPESIERRQPQNSNQRKRPENTASEQSPKRRRKEYRSSSKTSRKVTGTNHWGLLLILSFFFAIAVAQHDTKPYELKSLNNHEGIYFDDISEVNLYFSEWNLLVYYNLSTYWRELTAIQKSIRQLNVLCNDEIRLSRETCQATIQQLKHQMLETEHINEVLYQQNEKFGVRSRRAPLGIVGTISNRLFGILDQEFADLYEKQIHEIKNNEDYLRVLLKNQTSIAESTISVIKKNHNAVQLHLARIENQIETIVKKLNDSRYDILASEAFNSAAMLITLSLLAFQNIQRSIMSIVTDTNHGRINTLILTPAQLSEQLKIIRENLPHHLRLPGTGNTNSLMALYNSMHVKTRITQNSVLFNIQIPLLSAESYRLYQLIPIPTPHEGKYIYIDPDSDYLAVNHRRDRFTPISEEDLRTCQMLTNDQLICNLRKPVFTLRSNQSRCEIDLLNSQDRLSPFCKLKLQSLKGEWRKLHGESTWLFTLKKNLHIDVICGTVIYPLTLNGNGIIQLHENCILNHQTLHINSNKRESKLQLSFIPEQKSISNHLNLSGISTINASQVTMPIPQLTKEVDNNDLAELSDAINDQKQRVDNIPTINIHDLHHYTSTYVLLGIVIVIGLYLRYGRRKFTLRRSCSRPSPAPRSNKQGTPSTIELPKLNVETGACTEYI